MDLFNSFVSALTEIDRGTIMLLLLIVGSAAWTVRDMVGPVIRILMGPIALALSVVVYCAFVAFGLFNLKSMAEWMMWTICAATAGTALMLGSASIFASMSDRKEARLAGR